MGRGAAVGVCEATCGHPPDFEEQVREATRHRVCAQDSNRRGDAGVDELGQLRLGGPALRPKLASYGR